VDEWLPAADADALQAHVDAFTGWLPLARRRLGNFGGVPHPSGLLAEALPPWLARLAAALVAAGVFAEPPNQVLLNAYAGAGAGLDLHNDGPLFAPRVAIVSLGDPALLRFVPTAAAGPAAAAAALGEHTLLQRPRSLLVFAGAAYTDFRHGVVAAAPGVAVDGGTCRNLGPLCPGAAAGAPLAASPYGRRSLTVRRVPRVARAADDWTAADAAEHARRLAWWRAAVDERR
jgi:hypothetical protein